MKNNLSLFRKFLVLMALLVGLGFVVTDHNSMASAASLCCSYCGTQDFEVCFRNPDAVICRACSSCNPGC